MGKEHKVSDEQNQQETEAAAKAAAEAAAAKAKEALNPEELAKKAANAEDAMRRMGEERDKARKALEAMQAKVEKEKQEAERAKLDEVERLKLDLAERDRKIAATEERVRQQAVEGEVRIVALREGALDPSDVLTLMDRAEIKLNDDGSVMGVEEAIKAFKEKKPHLFGANNRGGKPPDGSAPRKGGDVGSDPVSRAEEIARQNARARGYTFA